MSKPDSNIKSFGDVAAKLARNPLGIIALFIVLVYGFACLVVSSAAKALTPPEMLPLIYFLVIFPVLVLGVFTWLVIGHQGKLYGPGDFKNEDNYFKVISFLSAATASRGPSDEASQQVNFVEIEEVARKATSERGVSSMGLSSILWVDDRPQNNSYERQALEAVGVSISLALNTEDALEVLSKNRFAAIISDMGRPQGSQEGYVLLEKVREMGLKTPFFIYAGSNTAERRREAVKRGAQGSTNNPNELFQMVTSAITRAAR